LEGALLSFLLFGGISRWTLNTSFILVNVTLFALRAWESTFTAFSVPRVTDFFGGAPETDSFLEVSGGAHCHTGLLFRHQEIESSRAMETLLLISFLTIIKFSGFLVENALTLTGSTLSLALCALVEGLVWIVDSRILNTLWNNFVAIGGVTIVTGSLACR